MRIAVIGPQGEDDFATNITAGLRSMGHVPVMIGSAQPRIDGWGPFARAASAVVEITAKDRRVAQRLAARLVQRVARAEAEAVITVQSLHPIAVEAIRELGVPVVLWFPDAIVNLGPLWMFSAPYTALYFKEPVLVDRVGAMLDLPVFYLPEAANSVLHRVPEGVAPGDGHVAVVGNFYPTRLRLLERLDEDGVPLRLYGSAFPVHLRSHPLNRLHTGLYVRGADKARVFRGASAVLNNLHPGEIKGVNCRLFEATGCGAAVVTEHREALPELFEIDHEVLAFERYDELVEKLWFFVRNPDDATSMGDAAARRTHADHSYETRLRTIVDSLRGSRGVQA